MPRFWSAALVLACVALPAREGRAAGREFNPIRPLLGRWTVDMVCGTDQSRMLIVLSEAKASFSGRMLDGAALDRELGHFDLLYNGSPGHYRFGLALPDNPILKLLKLDMFPGSLVVSDDPDDPDSPGQDYLSASSNVGVLKSLTTVKLRDRRRKATFIFWDESPLGKDQCRGKAAKQRA
jgi:hypothetical protein